MKKRSHKNTNRLTAHERAKDADEELAAAGCRDVSSYTVIDIIQRALQAHARAALRRKARR